MSEIILTAEKGLLPAIDSISRDADLALGITEVNLAYQPTLKTSQTKQQPVVDSDDLPEPEVPIIAPNVGTDADNAELFVSEHGEDIRWCETLDYWLIWDGVRWKRDDDLEIERLAEKTVRDLLATSAMLPMDKAKQVSDAGSKLLSQAKMLQMVEASKRKVTVSDTELDNDRGFLTVRNGVIDLRAGMLLPFDKTKMSTRMTDIVYGSTAKCPKWMEFLHMIMGGNEDDIRWLQRAFGYSLTGEGDAKMFAFLYGGGDNGKSTFLEVCNMVAGEYAQKSSIEALLAGQRSKEQKNTPYTAALRGARFVFTDEMLENSTLNSSLMKDLTGGDTLTGMGKYQSPITFLPSHFFWLYGNTKPIIRDDSDAMWGRVKLLKFGVTIPEEMRKPMNEVKDMFRAELPGILNWAIEGARIAIRDGIDTTDTIKMETKEYRDDEDIFGRWLKERCILESDKHTDKHHAFDDFHEWAEGEGIHEIPQAKTLTRRLEKFGITLGGGGKGDYVGFCLGNPEEPVKPEYTQEEAML
jgi:putative DNA primase/helicase